MRGDAVNLTRAMLARLSATTALIAVVCFLVFFTGNTGSLSGRAIAVASYGMGASGLAACMFAIATLVTAIVAPIAGARFSASSLAIAITSGLLGIAAILGSGISGAISQGLAF